MSDLTFRSKISSNKGDSLTINLNAFKLTLVGSASLKISLPKGVPASSLSLSLEKDCEEGIFVVNFRTCCFVNRVFREAEGNKIILDDKLYAPQKDRFIQTLDDGTVFAFVGEVIYTNKIQDSEAFREFEQYLVDADRICQYALGKIEVKELQEAVLEIKERLDLENELEFLKIRLSGFQEALERNYREKKVSCKKNIDLEEENNKLRRELVAWKKWTCSNLDAIKGVIDNNSWFSSRKIKNQLIGLYSKLTEEASEKISEKNNA